MSKENLMFLITGATGNVGREVVEQLLAQGRPVRAVTRDASRAAGLAGAEVVAGNPAEPDTLAEALAGVRALFLNVAALGGGSATGLLRLARERGVERVVLLSSSSVEDTGEHGDNLIARIHRDVEQQIRDSGLGWTFVRPGEFATNTSFQLAPQIRASDVVRAPYGLAGMAPIHQRDIAGVATLALLDERHAGQSHLLTGPESLTLVDKVRIIGEAIGRPLRFEELSHEEGERAMLATGLPAPVVTTLLGYLAGAVGHPAPISPVVEQLLGRPGLTYASWVAENTEVFRA
ncbi:NAD(P)H-binding protein [Kitasatospora viridis]|nr:NAD(P)H-binding protein [Kitasatospora viridis]